MFFLGDFAIFQQFGQIKCYLNCTGPRLRASRFDPPRLTIHLASDKPACGEGAGWLTRLHAYLEDRIGSFGQTGKAQIVRKMGKILGKPIGQHFTIGPALN